MAIKIFPAAFAADSDSNGTLAERFARGSLPIDEAAAIARQIVDTLAAARARGITHRASKPTHRPNTRNPESIWLPNRKRVAFNSNRTDHAVCT